MERFIYLFMKWYQKHTECNSTFWFFYEAELARLGWYILLLYRPSTFSMNTVRGKHKQQYVNCSWIWFQRPVKFAAKNTITVCCCRCLLFSQNMTKATSPMEKILNNYEEWPTYYLYDIQSTKTNLIRRTIINIER